MNMLLSGEIGRIEATEIIGKDRKQDPNLTYWESSFPGKGEALMKVLRPFYGWKPELKPALPDLKEQAKKAIFWKDISGVRVFTESDAGSLRDSLWASLWASLRASLWASLRASLRASLEASLEASLGASLGASLWDSHYSTLRTSYYVSLLYACAFILADKPVEAAKFQPLLDLWLTGNIPVGFDGDEKLLVLVADPE